MTTKVHASAILNWDASPDGKTLWCVEMSHNMLYLFDMTGGGSVLAGKSHRPKCFRRFVP